MRFSYSIYLYQLSALQIDELIAVHPGVNVSGARDMHHGSGKVAHGLVRGNHIIWTQNKVAKRTYPETKHSKIKDKTMCQAMIDQSGEFCQNSVVFAAPPPGTSYNQRPCPPMAN